MRYRKIHILGGPGSGKSSVAAKIAATFGIAAYDLDDLFWDPAAPTYGVRADKEQRDQALAALAGTAPSSRQPRRRGQVSAVICAARTRSKWRTLCRSHRVTMGSVG